MTFLNVVDDVIKFSKLCDVMINIFNIMIQETDAIRMYLLSVSPDSSNLCNL